jgi:hypothetical protein
VILRDAKLIMKFGARLDNAAAWWLLAAFALFMGFEGRWAHAQSEPGPRPTISFVSLDQNRDGALSRIEAAAVPRLLLDFDRVDRDHDGRLIPAEYNVWFSGG